MKSLTQDSRSWFTFMSVFYYSVGDQIPHGCLWSYDTFVLPHTLLFNNFFFWSKTRLTNNSLLVAKILDLKPVSNKSLPYLKHDIVWILILALFLLLNNFFFSWTAKIVGSKWEILNKLFIIHGTVYLIIKSWYEVWNKN